MSAHKSHSESGKSLFLFLLTEENLTLRISLQQENYITLIIIKYQSQMESLIQKLKDL